MKYNEAITDLEVDRMGLQLSASLTMASQHLGHDISERLRIARQRALQSRPALVLTKRQLASTLQSNGTLTGPSDEGLNFWSIFASALPLLALVLGLLLIQSMQTDPVTTDIARIDAALLTDELPPDAYTDPGFVQFLKLQAAQSASHD